MKKLNIQTILLLLISLAVFGIAGTAQATTASLYVSPASVTINAGDVITASVGINTASNKIYAVEGTLAFDKLTCQSITVAAGLQALSTPSCDSPHFLLGIPSGSADNKTLLTVTTKAETAGTATISMTGVNIVGGDAIKSISNSGGSGSYTIEASEAITAPATAVIPVTANKPIVKTVPVKSPTKSGEVLGTKIEGVTPSETSTNNPGTVLAAFDEQNPNDIKCNGLFASNVDKIVIGLLAAVIILLIGFIVLKKKKI